MSISIACDDCGKTYAVADTMLGKRVKCKQCGHLFLAQAIDKPRTAAVKPAPAAARTSAVKSAAATAKPAKATRAPVGNVPRAASGDAPRATAAAQPVRTNKPQARATPKPTPIEAETVGFDDEPNIDDWSNLEAGADAGEVFEPASSPVVTGNRRPVTRTSSVQRGGGGTIAGFSYGGFTRIVAIGLLVLFVAGSFVSPFSIIIGSSVFLLGAMLYFVVGLIFVVIQALRSSGELSISPGTVLMLALSLVLSVITRRPVILYRRRGGAGGSIGAGRVFGLLGNSLFILLMWGLLIASTIAFGSHIPRINSKMPRLLGGSGRPAVDETVADALDRYCDLLSSLNDKLDGISTPSDAKSANSSIEKLADDFDKLAEEFKTLPKPNQNEAAGIAKSQAPAFKKELDRLNANIKRFNGNHDIAEVLQYSVFKVANSADRVGFAIAQMDMRPDRSPTLSSSENPGTPGSNMPGTPNPSMPYHSPGAPGGSRGYPGNVRPRGLADKYPADQILTVKITGLSDMNSQGGALCAYLQKVAEAKTYFGSGSGNEYTVQLAPISNVSEVANEIDFGNVTLHTADRVIEIAADMTKVQPIVEADPIYQMQHHRADPTDGNSATPGATMGETPAQPAANPASSTPEAVIPMPVDAPAGMKVKVYKNSQWLPATLIKTEGRKYRVHYDGMPDSSDEWVTKNRIQPRQASTGQ